MGITNVCGAPWFETNFALFTNHNEL